MSSEPSTTDLARTHIRAVQEVEELKRRINRSTCERSNAETALVKRLLPKKPDLSMTYGIWLNGRDLGIAEKDVLITIQFVSASNEWRASYEPSIT